MNENTNPIHRVAFGKVTCTDEQLEALRAQALGANLTPIPNPRSVIRRDDGQHTPELVDDVLKSPVVLRSEYESLRQEFIRTLIDLNENLYPERQDFCFRLIEVKLRELGGFNDG